jgi:hypothetical protein
MKSQGPRPRPRPPSSPPPAVGAHAAVAAVAVVATTTTTAFSRVVGIAGVRITRTVYNNRRRHTWWELIAQCHANTSGVVGGPRELRGGCLLDGE